MTKPLIRLGLTARETLSGWHCGQSTAMYACQSTGTVETADDARRLLTEVEEALDKVSTALACRLGDGDECDDLWDDNERLADVHCLLTEALADD